MESQTMPVQFQLTKNIYSTNEKLYCYFYQPITKVEPNDWIGLFKVGWTSLKECEAKKTVLPSEIQQSELVNPELSYVVFEAYQLPKEEPGQFYQFVYVKNGDVVKGASQSFVFDSTVLPRGETSEQQLKLEEVINKIAQSIEMIEKVNQVSGGEMLTNDKYVIVGEQPELLELKQELKQEQKQLQKELLKQQHQQPQTMLQRLTLGLWNNGSEQQQQEQKQIEKLEKELLKIESGKKTSTTQHLLELQPVVVQVESREFERQLREQQKREHELRVREYQYLVQQLKECERQLTTITVTEKQPLVELREVILRKYNRGELSREQTERQLRHQVQEEEEVQERRQRIKQQLKQHIRECEVVVLEKQRQEQETMERLYEQQQQELMRFEEKLQQKPVVEQQRLLNEFKRKLVEMHERELEQYERKHAQLKKQVRTIERSIQEIGQQFAQKEVERQFLKRDEQPSQQRMRQLEQRLAELTQQFDRVALKCRSLQQQQQPKRWTVEQEELEDEELELPQQQQLLSTLKNLERQLLSEEKPKSWVERHLQQLKLKLALEHLPVSEKKQEEEEYLLKKQLKEFEQQPCCGLLECNKLKHREQREQLELINQLERETREIQQQARQEHQEEKLIRQQQQQPEIKPIVQLQQQILKIREIIRKIQLGQEKPGYLQELLQDLIQETVYQLQRQHERRELPDREQLQIQLIQLKLHQQLKQILREFRREEVEQPKKLWRLKELQLKQQLEFLLREVQLKLEEIERQQRETLHSLLIPTQQQHYQQQQQQLAELVQRCIAKHEIEEQLRRQQQRLEEPLTIETIRGEIREF